MVSELKRNAESVGSDVDLDLDLSGSGFVGQRIIQRMRRLVDNSHDFSEFTFGEHVDSARCVSELSTDCVPAEVSDFRMICNDYYIHDDCCYHGDWDEEKIDNSDLESSCNDYDGQDGFEHVFAGEEYDSDVVRSDCEYDGDRLLLPGLDYLRRSLGDDPLSGVLDAVNQSESFGTADIRALAVLLGDSQGALNREERAGRERDLRDDKDSGVRWADKQTFIPREGNEGGKYIR